MFTEILGVSVYIYVVGHLIYREITLWESMN